MSVLTIYGKQITTSFDLLGHNEDDITKSISWSLSKCDAFLKNFLSTICPHFTYELNNIVISSQEIENENGRTDIEISEAGNLIIIIEAKKGFILPSDYQLSKYANLLKTKYSNIKQKLLFSLSNYDESYANGVLKTCIDSIPLKHISYKTIISLAGQSIEQSSNQEKHILKELIKYLKGVNCMENKDSNIVYVVPISGDSIKLFDEKRIYKCPVGGKKNTGKYPLIAPNYLGFRYNGYLQAICHVDDVEYETKDDTRYFVFHLGDPIKPNNVKSGPIWNQRFSIEIDLLLTSSSVKEANDKQHLRNK